MQKTNRIDDENNDVDLEIDHILGNRHHDNNHSFSSAGVADTLVLIGPFFFGIFKDLLEVISERLANL
jgi:hypothetical protein